MNGRLAHENTGRDVPQRQAGHLLWSLDILREAELTFVDAFVVCSNRFESCRRWFRHSEFVIPSDLVIRHSGLRTVFFTRSSPRSARPWFGLISKQRR
jgi:hypothetical protein